MANAAELQAALETVNRTRVPATLLLADGTYLYDVPALDLHAPGLVIRSATGNRDAVIVRDREQAAGGNSGRVFSWPQTAA